MGGMDRITILVADAQPLFADVLASALACKPRLDVCDERPDTAARAIDLAGTAKPDVALIDYWFDAMAAPEVARAILERAPYTKLVILSWLHGPEHVEASLSAGAVGFLPKSVSVDHVGEAAYRAHAGERPVFEEQLTTLVRTIREREHQASVKMERFAALTARELEVVRRLAEGLSADEIAERLGITPWTVRTHIRNLLPKTGARTQLEVVAMAQGTGLAWRTSRPSQ